MSDDLKCPHCGTTKYRNPSLKLMVNACGHGICENCVNLLFVKGSGECPTCNVSLRRKDFRLQLFEDDYVEKEVDIRKKILKIYNRKEEDFPSLAEYNDYLEEVENIIFNLANNIDKELTERKIKLYEKENALLISKNKNRLSKDEELIESILEREKEEKLDRLDQYLMERNEMSKKEKERLEEEFLNKMMFSNESGSQIVAKHKENLRKRDEEMSSQNLMAAIAAQKERRRKQAFTFSTGIRVGKGASSANVNELIAKPCEDVLYEYNAPDLDINGPVFPDYEQLESDGYLLHVRDARDEEKAGGFTSHYACYRALQESFCGLYFQAD